MKPDELRKVLAEMEPTAKAEMKKKARAESMSDEECVYAIAERTWEERFSHALHMRTESDRAGEATIEAARYARLAYHVAILAAVLSLVGTVASVVALVR